MRRMSLEYLLRRVIAWNRQWSGRFEGLLQRCVPRPSGMGEFGKQVRSNLLRLGLRVLDVGGGKRPLVDVATKQRLGLYVAGLDISAEELAAAPPGSYDETIVGDVATVAIGGRFDLIVSHTVLEHVRDTPAAIRNLSNALSADGTMAHFVPCTLAGYAVLNRLLGNTLAAELLWAIYPERRSTSGFKAYYDHCTPRSMRRLFESAGLQVEALRAYYRSDYFSFCTPLYVAEALRQTAMHLLRLENLAETFLIIGRKASATANGRRAA